MRSQQRRFEPRCVTRSARPAHAPARSAWEGAMSNTYAFVRSSRQSVRTTVLPCACPHIGPSWSRMALDRMRIGGYTPTVSSGERRKPRSEGPPIATPSRDDPPAGRAAPIRSNPKPASTTSMSTIAARSATVPRRAGVASSRLRDEADPRILAISSSATGSTAYTESSEDSTARADMLAPRGAWPVHHGTSLIRPPTGSRWTASARLPVPSARQAAHTRPSRAG